MYTVDMLYQFFMAALATSIFFTTLCERFLFDIIWSGRQCYFLRNLFHYTHLFPHHGGDVLNDLWSLSQSQPFPTMRSPSSSVRVPQRPRPAEITPQENENDPIPFSGLACGAPLPPLSIPFLSSKLHNATVKYTIDDLSIELRLLGAAEWKNTEFFKKHFNGR